MITSFTAARANPDRTVASCSHLRDARLRTGSIIRPIRRRKRRYILTADQSDAGSAADQSDAGSDAGSAGIFSDGGGLTGRVKFYRDRAAY
eukprot:7437760-Pyramimonas_sp.AAC.1